MNAVLSNGRFFTSDDAMPWADTVVMQDGMFTFVGSGIDYQNAEGLPAQDLGGRVVLPGLIDAHTHPGLVAASRWHVALPEVDRIEDLLDFIRDYGRSHSIEQAPYLHFEYYPTALFAHTAPTAQLLDSAISDRPVLCQDSGDHASWVNTRMLELLGVDETTPDPVPGLERFIRDEHGNPTGHIMELAHVKLLPRMYEAIGWSPPETLTPDIVRPVLDFLKERGVVALFEAVIEQPEMLATLHALAERGELGLHYEGAVRFRTLTDLPEAIATVKSFDATYGTDRIRVRTVKLFLDGTNELGSSAVIDRLSSDENAGPYGAIQMESAELAECLALCADADVDVHIHMVGDRAFRVACDAVEAAQKAALSRGAELGTQVTFAHCELVDPSDMRRPAELGVIVNWTNHWSGGYFGEEARHHLGDDRWNRMYEFNAIADAGALLTFSSDVVSQAELHRADPFFGMQVALTRIDPENPLDPERFVDSVRPSDTSRISLERLLRGYTINAARQLRIDTLYGSISVGKRANLVVLDNDLFAVKASEVGSIHPTAVVVDGEVAFGAF
ncbi:amidohydrolase [Microbacterium sp. PMB16]|uniref:amidohydrolase n=1 Tax=Microbacterium sp. PMB16 TaxID=3120157 RepID=UPI003F4B0B04